MEKEILLQLYDHYQNSSGISIDSRTIKPGQIFWAIKGEHFNGHDFIKEALDKWAYLCVVQEEVPEEYQPCCLKVPDTIQALQELAVHHRSHLKIPIVAITGSNGKTTTKELLRSCFKHQSAYVSLGNFNNHIGLPFALLQIQKHHRFAILEMGDNHSGEIKKLCKIAKPTAGLITNIGKDHIGNYKSIEENAKSKCELYDYILEHTGKIFVNEDDELLKPYGRFIDSLTFGTKSANLLGRIIESELGRLVVAIRQENWNQEITIKTQLTGDYHLYNILAAVQIAMYLQVPMGEIISGMSSYHPDNLRSQILNIDNKAILLDCYNANPSSVIANLQSLKKLITDKKSVIVLGDMNELGEHTVHEHQNLAPFIDDLNPILFLAIGSHIQHTFNLVNAPKLHFPNIDSIDYNLISNYLQEADFIFIKGSRTNQLEKILDKFSLKQNV